MKNTLLLASLMIFTVCLSNQAFAQPGGPGGGIAPVITEIMYNPPEAQNDTLEFLEILNPSLTSPIVMTGYYFSSGIEFTFPDGFTLGAGDFVIISGDSVIFEEWYGLEAFEWTGGTALSNDGEGLALRNAADAVVDTVFFDDTNAWADADATGYSLVLCDPSADNNLPASWTLSENATGITVNSLEIYADPGALSTCTPTGIADDNVITTAIYPNPTNDVFRMDFGSMDRNATVSVRNGLGQLVYAEMIPSGTTSLTIDAKLSSGLYLVSVDNEETIETHRLIVQ